MNQTAGLLFLLHPYWEHILWVGAIYYRHFAPAGQIIPPQAIQPSAIIPQP